MAASEIGIAADGNYRDRYLAWLDGTIRWFAVRSRMNMWLYNGSRIALVVLSASLPVLISNHQAMISTPISVIVAILAGLEAQFKPGDQWKHQRSAELSLKQLKRDYEHNLALSLAGTAHGADDPFEVLYGSVTAFLKAEPTEFWHSRLTTWSRHNA